MKNILTIFKKELSAYFNSPSAYIVLVIFLGIIGFAFSNTVFVINQAEMRQIFGIIPWLLLIVIPALTMKTIAEEKKTGTLELLVTMPLKDTEIVLGKFFANLALIFVAFLMTFPQFFTIVFFASPEVGVDYGVIFAGYFGLLLFGGVIISLGIFASSLTDNQIAAFILAFIIAAILFFIDKVLIFFPLGLQKIFEYISLDFHLKNIMRGVIDSRDVLYYLSLTFIFVFLSKVSLESRKY